MYALSTEEKTFAKTEKNQIAGLRKMKKKKKVIL